MVGVAQLAECRIVIPVVAGSTPVAHPIKSIIYKTQQYPVMQLVFVLFCFCWFNFRDTHIIDTKH